MNKHRQFTEEELTALLAVKGVSKVGKSVKKSHITISAMKETEDFMVKGPAGVGYVDLIEDAVKILEGSKA